MAQTIGTIILVVLALVAVTAVLNFILGVLGSLFPLLINVAIFGGIFYLAWLVFRKLSNRTES